MDALFFICEFVKMLSHCQRLLFIYGFLEWGFRNKFQFKQVVLYFTYASNSSLLANSYSAIRFLSKSQILSILSYTCFSISIGRHLVLFLLYLISWIGCNTLSDNHAIVESLYFGKLLPFISLPTLFHFFFIRLNLQSNMDVDRKCRNLSRKENSSIPNSESILSDKLHNVTKETSGTAIKLDNHVTERITDAEYIDSDTEPIINLKRELVKRSRRRKTRQSHDTKTVEEPGCEETIKVG